MATPASSEELNEPPAHGGVHTYNYRPDAGQSQGHKPSDTPEQTEVREEEEEEEEEAEEEEDGN